MTLTKADLIKSLMKNTRLWKEKSIAQQSLFPDFNYQPLSRKRAERLLDSTLNIIKKNLEKGESVLLSDFGKFQVRFKWARKGRNPRTGETIILRSRRVVTFRCSPKLRERINRPLRELSSDNDTNQK